MTDRQPGRQTNGWTSLRLLRSIRQLHCNSHQRCTNTFCYFYFLLSICFFFAPFSNGLCSCYSLFLSLIQMRRYTRANELYSSPLPLVVHHLCYLSTRTNAYSKKCVAQHLKNNNILIHFSFAMNAVHSLTFLLP